MKEFRDGRISGRTVGGILEEFWKKILKYFGNNPEKISERGFRKNNKRIIGSFTGRTPVRNLEESLVEFL